MSKATLATEFERAEDSPGFLLWQLSNKWQARQRAALKPYGLTHVQFVLLATLTFAVGKRTFTQKQLADYARTDVMMTSQVVRKLEQRGLLWRQLSKLDARAFTVNPTPRGIELANQAVTAVEAVDHDFFALVGNELPNLLGMMRKLLTCSPNFVVSATEPTGHPD